MKDFILSKIAISSFSKLCFLIAINVSTILALIFLLSNHGRRVNFGTFYFYDFQADVVGSVFLLVSVCLVISILGAISYLPLCLLIKIAKGIKIKAVAKAI